MTFIWPIMLLLLLGIPPIAWLYRRSRQRRYKALEQSGNLGWLQGAIGATPGVRRAIPNTLFLLGIVLLLIALARPQSAISFPRIEGTVVLAFDVSGSMGAKDWAPTRMEAAKVVAREFVEQQPPDVQIGVVAFSDSGIQIQAPTNDQTAVIAAINRLKPQRGTSLGQGIQAALNTLEMVNDPTKPRLRYSNLQATPTPQPPTKLPGMIVLLTDGENTAPPDPMIIARQAAGQDVRISTIGVGSPEGITLQVEGFSVHTQLDEAMLRQIADITRGNYYNAKSPAELRSIYKDLELQLVIKPEQTEITALFAGAGILTLLIGGICSLLWFGRMP